MFHIDTDTCRLFAREHCATLARDAHRAGRLGGPDAGRKRLRVRLGHLRFRLRPAAGES